MSDFKFLFFVIGLVLVTRGSTQNPEASEFIVGKDLPDGEGEARVSDVDFLLWTRENINSDNYFILEYKDSESLASSPFDGRKRTYFVFHGFNSNGETSWILEMKNNILSLEDANFISVDYRDLADVFYETAVKNMYDVANYTASFIDWLTEESFLTPSNIHNIGHSLGGHCAGLTAQYMTAGLVDRVTGLDPAGPNFYNKSAEETVDKTDASFVDIIHTNGCPIYQGCYGILKPLGHVDFYPNGGGHQAGCTLPGNSTGDLIDIFGCSHGRSHTYWNESFRPQSVNGSDVTFTAWPCEDYDTFLAGECPDCGQGCLEMGFFADRGLEGNYYLTTNAISPFPKGNVQQ